MIRSYYFLICADKISLVSIVTNRITSVTQLLFVTFIGGIIYFIDDQSADVLTALVATLIILTIVAVIPTTVVAVVLTAVGAICATICAEATIITVPAMSCNIHRGL